MADIEKELQEVRREVVEARNLVIKTDNLLKNLQADVKLVAKKQDTFERRSWMTSATAYILFMTVSALGAYMYARGALEQKRVELAFEKESRAGADKARDDALKGQSDAAAASARALALYDRLSSTDDAKRDSAIEEVAKLEKGAVSALEAKALEDKSHSLRQAAADSALESGRNAFNRREYRAAADHLERHRQLSLKGPEDISLLLLGQSYHALRDWKSAVPAFEAFLKAAPLSKSGDYATMLLGEALAESGERERAITVYRAGADKYYQSQFSPWMRQRARKIEQALKGEPATPAAPAPAPTAAVPPVP